MVRHGFICDYYDIKHSTIVIQGFFVKEGNDELIIPEVIDHMPVVAIDNAAFRECRELKKASLPDSLQFIGDDAFRSCQNLEKVYIYKTTVATPSAILEIGKRAFYYCEKLSIFNGDCAVAVGERAFDECRQLLEFTCHILYASKHAFRRCKNLMYLNFGHNAHWESNSFSECKNVIDLYFYYPLARYMLTNQYQMRFLHGKNIYCCKDFNYMDCVYEGESVIII